MGGVFWKKRKHRNAINLQNRLGPLVLLGVFQFYKNKNNLENFTQKEEFIKGQGKTRMQKINKADKGHTSLGFKPIFPKSKYPGQFNSVGGVS